MDELSSYIESADRFEGSFEVPFVESTTLVRILDTCVKQSHAEPRMRALSHAGSIVSY